MKIKVSCIQMQVDKVDYAKNIAKSILLVEKAAKQGAQLIVLPELFTFSADGNFKNMAEKIPLGKTVRLFSKLARKYKAYIIGSIAEQGLYNTAFLVGSSGYVGKHRKVYGWGKEKKKFKFGDTLEVFNTSIGKIGMLICYEMDFNENARKLALQGAEIITVSSAYTDKGEYELHVRARAIESTSYVIFSNRCGRTGKTVFSGRSMIADPYSKLIGKLGRNEGVLIKEIDLLKVAKARKEIPYLKDFRRELYY